MLVSDYMQLMSGDGSNRDNRNAQVEAIPRSLKALAKELDMVVIALPQLSRNGANKDRASINSASQLAGTLPGGVNLQPRRTG